MLRCSKFLALLLLAVNPHFVLSADDDDTAKDAAADAAGF
jgi:hypothetical protein